MTQTLYVDPAHRIPDEDWAAVVRRAEEIAREAAENRTGGAAPIAGPVIDMRGRSNKHSGVSGAPTQLLVLHSAECPLMPGYAQSLTEWAITSTVVASWHRFIGPDSRVYMIPDNLAAWHASEANPMSIGWEQAGYARYTRADWVSPNGMLQMESLAYDMAQVALAEGIPPVWLTTEQVTAITTYGDRTTKGFCLHRQIDPETRTDPGDGYPYELLMAKIRSYMGISINPQGLTTESEENELNKDQDAALSVVFHKVNKAEAAGQLASQGDINIVLARMSALEATVREALGKPHQAPVAVLVKGDQEATVYAWDGGDAYRALEYDEFASLMAAGADLRIQEQARIDAALGGK